MPAPVMGYGAFDAETEALIANAERVAFLVPFSHWDTDWHDTFDVYSRLSNRNILSAIQLAKAEPRFRYALEQVAFVKHFWDTHPERRADLKALVENRQFTFAWAGVTQPETSLAAPAVQMRNWQLGRDWIAATFGEEYVPQTAWQSDAFGNSAALPLFLQQVGVPYLFIGRWQHRCDPDHAGCVPLPLHFYWKSSATEARVLAAYVFYSDAWGDIFRAGDDETKQLEALRAYVDKQFERTSSRYALIPLGFDFLDPLPQTLRLVDANNADSRTVFVVSDPETAFQYVATESLPEFEVDLNPIWQAFYGSRPYAKITDKESEFFLTANDKFSLLAGTPQSSAWYTATFNAHYDNLGAVSYDRVWEAAQRPRFQQTVETAAADLAGTLARLASGVEAPLVVFNPTSWARSEVIEIQRASTLADLPHQPLSTGGAALRVEAVPGVGYAALSPAGEVAPVIVSAGGDAVTLRNDLVSVTLDPARGGTFSNLSASVHLLTGPGDDLTFWTDTGDIYGARFGEIVARASDTPASVIVLEGGPLLARVQAAFSLGGQPVTKTVTVRAGSPLVEVVLQVRALPETSAVVHTRTRLQTGARTDDLGFGAFTHVFDPQPITPGDITYRRKIFYPTLYWTDVSDSSVGLTLITHGLQGISGVNELGLLLARSVTDKDGEGLTDPDTHTLRYAYQPHAGDSSTAWQYAYAFNQPLIPVWRTEGVVNVQLPFRETLYQLDAQPAAVRRLPSLTFISAESGFIADVYRQGAQIKALLLDYDPTTPAAIAAGTRRIQATGPVPQWVDVELTP